MFLDHTYDAFSAMGAPIWMTLLGRVVAPIFLFLSSEGYHYTHSKWNYMKNLLIFFWITNIATSLIQIILPNPHIILINSMLGTLFLTVLAMWTWDGLCSFKIDKSYFIKSLFSLFYLIVFPFIVIMLSGLFQTRWFIFITLNIPTMFFVEGGPIFILLGLLFYIFRKNRLLQVGILLIISLIVLISGNWVQSFMALAVIPIYLYNGMQGKKMKWFFYIFYPAHIVLIYSFVTWFFY